MCDLTNGQTPCAVPADGKHLVGVTDQSNRRVAVYDLAVPDWTNDPSALVWEFCHGEYCRAVAGLKFRHNEKLGGDVVLFCGPAGGTIVSYDTKEVLYHTDDTPVNPHSVELLPDGTFLVSGTQGKAVHAFDPVDGKAARTARLEIHDGHGLLWDPRYALLWVSGGYEIRAYAVSGDRTHPVFRKARSYGNLPGWIHDLAPVYGDVSRLWFTCDCEGVLQLEKETGRLIRDVPDAVSAKSIGSSGVGSFPDGVVIWTCGTGKTDSWTTDEVQALFPSNGTCTVYKANVGAWYKCRVWIKDYQ